MNAKNVGIALARAAKKYSKAEKTIIHIKRTANLVQNTSKSLPNSPNISSESSREVTPQATQTQNYFQGKARHIKDEKVNVVFNILNNLFKPPTQRRWLPTTMKLFLGLSIISFSSYLFLHHYGIAPSKNTLRKYMNDNFFYDSNYWQNISLISDLCKNYREMNGKLSQTDEIMGVLAVDAMSTSPYLTIDKKGLVHGAVIRQTFEKEELQRLSNYEKLQEKIFLSFKDSQINNCFVYQFQPLSKLLPCFVVHIHPSNTGKANQSEIFLLKKIAIELRKNNIIVMAYAADGDSGYKTLTNSTIERLVSERPYISFDQPLFSNDPLHLLKRARYRLLKHNLVPLLKEQNSIENTGWRELLGEPEIVFSDQSLTKMKDDLPLRLFSFKNFMLLYENMEWENNPAAFFLPCSLLIEAINSKILTIDERVDFLEIVFHYLKFYKQLLETVPNNQRYPQKCKNTGNIKCYATFFDNSFIDDVLSTIISIDSFINSFVGEVCLNRIGTNPLEHHFGLLRIKCKYKNDWENILTTQSKISILRDIETDLIGSVVNKRKDTFGVDISVSTNEYGEKFGYTNRKIAYVLLKYFGFPVQYLNTRSNFCDEITLLTIFESK